MERGGDILHCVSFLEYVYGSGKKERFCLNLKPIFFVYYGVHAIVNVAMPFTGGLVYQRQ